ncbi:hypothetical protein PSTG_11259 [Puccinia striiformis f. sp. tritici PST-78]|uniref:Uncharacterized protein n=1 Tax=Puccinia striiformis f. sp. tritici PST-78 TaxID=1165861 RepID=A0A0L0V872_9BASI|nr:hypothetical protein PSTG_11259 [Puccinia striiformis f. sp. tritici PST-78]
MDQPNLPGEEEPIVAGAVPEEVEGAQPALLAEPLGYLMTVLRSGANGQLLEFTYLEILVPIEDLINTLTDRQQLLSIVSFLEQDVHMYQLRHVPNPQNQVQIEPPPPCLQAEADQTLQILMRTHRERYTDFHFELLDEYLNLLIHSEDSQDRAHGMSVLLQHLFNTNGSALEMTISPAMASSSSHVTFLTISTADASKLGYLQILTVLSVEPQLGFRNES